MWMLVVLILSVHVQTGTCDSCTAGSYWSSFNEECFGCRDKCEACSSYNSCDTCDAGYYGNKCQFECSHACEDGRCDKSNARCTCIDGYYRYSYYSWYRLYYDCETCPDNCATCTSSTECTSCHAGYFGRTCDQQCRNCKNNKCMIDGQCSDGCSDGYSPNFAGCCPSNCAACTSSTGCTSCHAGYFGRTCDKICRNCKNNKCMIDGRCSDGCLDGYSPTFAGCCPSNCAACTSSTGCTSCHAGYFGRTCDQPCRNCKNNKCMIDGQCSDGCLDGYSPNFAGCCPSNCAACTSSTGCTSCNTGYFGRKCDKTCLYCKNNTCLLENGSCLTGCIDGYFEKTSVCEPCPRNCSICSSDTECDECVPGCYGNTCRQECPQNCETCKNATNCLLCNNGCYGQICETKCSSLCKNGCSKEDGGCNGCIDAYYEEDGHCNECSGGCAICENIDECIRCQNGFFTEQNTTKCNACGDNCSTCNGKDFCTECNEGYAIVNVSCLSCQNCNDSTACLRRNVCDKCFDGFFGSYCGGKCNETCIRCDRLTGECSECKDNTFGLFCEQKCSSHCLQSLDNSSNCWKQNGTCKDGCEKEFSGPYCIAEISSATSPQVAIIVGSTSGVVALVIVVIVVVIIMYRMRVKQQCSNVKGGKSRGSLGPRAANEVVNQAYDDMNTYPTTVSGHQSNHSGVAVDSADHVYFVLQEASPQKPAQPNKAHVHDVNNVETDNVYDVTSGGNKTGMQADIKMSQDQGDTYSHISHASRTRQLRHDDEGAYDHVTRHNIQRGDGDNTYDVTSGLHGYDIHVQKTSKQSADEYSTIRHVQ